MPEHPNGHGTMDDPQIVKLTPDSLPWPGNPPYEQSELDLVENPLTTSVAATDTQLLQNDPSRVFWRVFNLGGSTIMLRHKTQGGITLGVPVAAGVGYAEMSAREDGPEVGYSLYATPFGAAATVYVIEGRARA